MYLAGGLSPDNVAEGLEKINPAGVDVSTGVSTYGIDFQRKDRKSPEKIKSFIEIARSVNG